MAKSLLVLGALLAAGVASAKEDSSKVLCDKENPDWPVPCTFQGYMYLNDHKRYRSAAEFNSDTKEIDNLKKSLQKVLPMDAAEEFAGEFTELRALPEHPVDLNTDNIRVEVSFVFNRRASHVPGDEAFTKLRAGALLAAKPQFAAVTTSAFEPRKKSSSGDDDSQFKKKAAHRDHAVAAPYPYPADMEDPMRFPNDWASWGEQQSWEQWDTQGGHSHGSGGYPNGGSRYRDHDRYDDDDDDGKRTIKIIIVILVILVQIGLIILIAVCIKHYCCSDNKQATAPAQQQQAIAVPPAGQRTAVVTPIHIIHGAPGAVVASPQPVLRSVSTPQPPAALALEVPGPAHYTAPSPQQLRRATSLTAIIA